MLILADVGNVAEAREPAGSNGSRTAACWCALPARIWPPTDDDLVPVKLRRGGRILGGSLSWDKPQQLAALFARQPVQRHGGAERRHRHAPGAGRARRAADRPHLGDARPTARRWSPRSAAAKACWCCSMSPPTRAGRTCRCPAPSSTCSGASSRSPVAAAAARRRPTRQLRGAPRKWCRRPACSTASALSRRRRRPRGRSRPISPAAPTPIIRPASTARRKAWSRSTRWRRPTGRRRSTSPPLNARLDVYRHGEPLDLRGPVFLAALALLMLDALVVFWLSGGLRALRPRRRAAAAIVARRRDWRLRRHVAAAQAQAARRTAAEAFRAGTKTSR